MARTVFQPNSPCVPVIYQLAHRADRGCAGALARGPMAVVLLGSGEPGHRRVPHQRSLHILSPDLLSYLEIANAARRFELTMPSTSAPPHSYALLVTAGLEDVAAASIAELLPGLSIRVLPRAQLAKGREAGAAGGVGVLLVDSADVLSPAVCASPCVAAALALVVQCELPEGAPLAAEEESTPNPDLT